MKRVRVYVVIDVEEELKPEEVSASVAEVLDGIVGEPLFAFTAEGYGEEFRSFGADPTSWGESGPEKECSLDTPCGLCKRRKKLEGIFVSGKDAAGKSQTLCSSCLATHREIDVGSPDVQVWEVGSPGWFSAPVCDDCKEEIDVVLLSEETPA